MSRFPRLSMLAFILFFVFPSSQVKTAAACDSRFKQQEQHEVQSGKLIKKVAPDYPKKARRAHVEGTVRLHAIIATDGSVKNLEVVSGDPLLVNAALKAVRQWRYQPTQLDGRPVEVDTTIDVNFALAKGS